MVTDCTEFITKTVASKQWNHDNQPQTHESMSHELAITNLNTEFCKNLCISCSPAQALIKKILKTETLKTYYLHQVHIHLI